MFCFLQRLDLRNNYIGKLANDSFTIYPNIRILLLSYNQVHTIEAESLEVLSDLKTLDLSQNAMKEVPAGLPKSLVTLYLNGNPVVDMRNLDRAVGLQVLHLRSCDLNGYPALGLLPNLVELDVSNNGRIRDLSPVQLAGTCRLAKLNVTGARLFPADRPGSHCRCRRVHEWAHTYKIQLMGVGPCPEPLAADKNGGDDDPGTENCARAPDEALAVFKACMAEWEHRNTPYWAICTGLAIVVAMLLALCVCLRRRRRRGRRHRAVDKMQQQNNAAATGGDCAKESANGGSDSAAVVGSAANNKCTEPAALLQPSLA